MSKNLKTCAKKYIGLCRVIRLAKTRLCSVTVACIKKAMALKTTRLLSWPTNGNHLPGYSDMN